jgi:hypothetical protein
MLKLNSNSPKSLGSDYEHELASFFREYGWKVKVEPSFGSRKADLLISQGGHRYIVELKAASEGRGDRVVPLLAQAILQAAAVAKASPKPAAPLAVVAAPVLSAKVVAHVESFLAENAPGAAAGIFDREGLRFFVGAGLQPLNALPASRVRGRQLALPDSAPLFSDLNQWMLKLLLAPLVHEDLLRAPRQEYRTASQLAEAAGVSVMSAFRFVRQLRQERFLNEDDGILRLVRRDELMQRWKATHLRTLPELPLRWILPGKSAVQLAAALNSYIDSPNVKEKPGLRVCLGLFAAAEQLGLGFVTGVSPSFYLENLDRAVLSRLGLSPEVGDRPPDVYVRVPSARESVFRAAVLRDGVPVADILQVWLDLSAHPARGAAQAQEIRRRALAAIFKEKA